jgi:hypothetical protein
LSSIVVPVWFWRFVAARRRAAALGVPPVRWHIKYPGGQRPQIDNPQDGEAAMIFAWAETCCVAHRFGNPAALARQSAIKCTPECKKFVRRAAGAKSVLPGPF